jgi:hypothetical protein
MTGQQLSGKGKEAFGKKMGAKKSGGRSTKANQGNGAREEG